MRPTAWLADLDEPPMLADAWLADLDADLFKGTGGAISVGLDRAFDLDNDECEARGVLSVDDDASEPLEVIGGLHRGLRW